MLDRRPHKKNEKRPTETMVNFKSLHMSKLKGLSDLNRHIFFCFSNNPTILFMLERGSLTISHGLCLFKLDNPLVFPNPHTYNFPWYMNI